MARVAQASSLPLGRRIEGIQLDRQEVTMGLAYCILAHKNPAQIARLLQAIAHPDNLYVLHYEKRAPRAEHEALARLAEGNPQLHLLASRHISWGRFSQIGTQLKAMEHLLRSDRKWSHFITLSGQDFPLKPQTDMVRELAEAATSSFVSFFDPFVEPYWNNVEDRIGRVHIDMAALEALLKIPFLGRRLRALCGWTNQMPFVPLVRRARPDWFRFIGGSNHVILSRVAAACFSTDPTARRIIQRLRHSGHPDESIFQSVLLNSPLASSVVNDDRRAIRWESHGAPSPLTLTLADLPWLREERSRGKLFARKFDPNVDNEVLAQLEKDLGL